MICHNCGEDVQLWAAATSKINLCVPCYKKLAARRRKRILLVFVAVVLGILSLTYLI